MTSPAHKHRFYVLQCLALPFTLRGTVQQRNEPGMSTHDVSEAYSQEHFRQVFCYAEMLFHNSGDNESNI